MNEVPRDTGTSNEAAASLKTPRFAMPDTYIIVAVIVLVMAALTWVIPPGTYDYHEVDVNGRMRSIAIDGTFRFLPESEANPTGPLAYFASLYTGCV
ncbi:MAG TPA: hypothetical protein VLT81_15295, partial [Chondromyces sp.]|nr:hypothetical protein [Chondromyces sp.]